MTDSSDASDVIQRRERKINRRTLTYGVSVVLATAVLVIAIVWLGSRRGECFGTDTLLCSQKDRRLAVFGYTHVAADAGYDLARYPSVVAWLGRVRDQPGFVDDLARYPENARTGASRSIYD